MRKPTHEDIEALAYKFWLERTEEDWLRTAGDDWSDAERLLMNKYYAEFKGKLTVEDL